MLKRLSGQNKEGALNSLRMLACWTRIRSKDIEETLASSPKNGGFTQGTLTDGLYKESNMAAGAGSP